MAQVLSFHYVLFGSNGETIDTSREGAPFPVMQGAQQIIPGLEEELFKMKVGDKKKVTVPVEKAYGPVNEKLRMKVPRSKFPAETKIEAGMQFKAGAEAHAPVFTVIAVSSEEVSLDGNHPLAGQALTFEVEVMEVREATAEETQHGHAHGPHGHH